MQNIIIYKFKVLYHILKELSSDLNFDITFVDSDSSLNDKVKKLDKYLIISNKKISGMGNYFVLDYTPVNIFKLVEKINIELLKLQFNIQSQFKVNNYFIDLNSRNILFNNIKLNLTEKEIKIIIYLSKKDKPVSIDELQAEVWDYKSNIETHTVETHVYRLRKKILKTFSDNKFIISEHNGYQIK